MSKEEIIKKLGFEDILPFDSGEYFISDRKGYVELSIKIDLKEYKNVLSSYSEVLKKYFKGDKITVLSRVEASSFKALFARKRIMPKEKTFTSCYLVIKNAHRLLITREKSILHIEELPPCEEKIFVHRGYKYKEANVLKL